MSFCCLSAKTSKKSFKNDLREPLSPGGKIDQKRAQDAPGGLQKPVWDPQGAKFDPRGGAKFDPRSFFFWTPGRRFLQPPASHFRTQVGLCLLYCRELARRAIQFAGPKCTYIFLDIVFRSLLAARAVRNLNASDISRIVRPSTRKRDSEALEVVTGPLPEVSKRHFCPLQLPTVFRTRSRDFTPGGPFWTLGRRFLHVSPYLARRNARSD